MAASEQVAGGRFLLNTNNLQKNQVNIMMRNNGSVFIGNILVDGDQTRANVQCRM